VATSKRAREALDRLAKAEDLALNSEVLAPMVRGGVVRIRIAGVVCRFKVDSDFEGWGVFRPTSPTTAALVRSAGLAERREYLSLLPPVRVIACSRAGGQWMAMPAHQADSRFRIEGLIPILLVEEAQLFETLLTRFDGAHFWYEAPDPRHDPARAAYLRDSLGRLIEPERLARPGLTVEESAAYRLNYEERLRAEREAKRIRVEERLREALAHAGAQLRDYQERGDIYRVTYEVDGRRHVSVVEQKNLSVQVAGICLSGQDRRFDLQSLVGVLREAQDRGGIVRVGGEEGGMREDDYWDVHPPAR
jgi:hypothetical protein